MIPSSSACVCGHEDCWSCQMQKVLEPERTAARRSHERLEAAFENLAKSDYRLRITAESVTRERRSASETQRVPRPVGLNVSGLHRILPAHAVDDEEDDGMELLGPSLALGTL